MKLIIYGEPKAKQSAKFARIGKFMKSYQPKEVINAEANIKMQIISQLKELFPEGFEVFTGSVAVSKLHYVFSPLKSFTKKKMKMIEDGMLVYKDTKPDLSDNLNKMLFDAMQGIIYDNDSRVVSMDNVKKYYGTRPRIEIEIEEIT